MLRFKCNHPVKCPTHGWAHSSARERCVGRGVPERGMFLKGRRPALFVWGNVNTKRIKFLWLLFPKRRKACWEAGHGGSQVQEGAQLSQITGREGSPQTDQGSFSSIKVNAKAMVSKQQKAMTEVGSDRPARTASESWATPTPPGPETGSLR